jgi:hypothetical protein
VIHHPASDGGDVADGLGDPALWDSDFAFVATWLDFVYVAFVLLRGRRICHP